MKLSASVSCLDLLNLKSEIRAIEESSVEFLHYDVVDGALNDCFIFGDQTLKAIRSISDLPIEVHLAVQNPYRYIRPFVRAGATSIAIHREVIDDPTIFDYIRSLGLKPILAYKCDTMPSSDDIPFLERVDGVLKLMVKPGYSGQKMHQDSLNHLCELRTIIDSHRLNLSIHADGNISPETIRSVITHGADIVTGGTSGVFIKGTDFNQNINSLKKEVNDVYRLRKHKRYY